MDAAPIGLEQAVEYEARQPTGRRTAPLEHALAEAPQGGLAVPWRSRRLRRLRLSARRQEDRRVVEPSESRTLRFPEGGQRRLGHRRRHGPLVRQRVRERQVLDEQVEREERPVLVRGRVLRIDAGKREAVSQHARVARGHRDRVEEHLRVEPLLDRERRRPPRVPPSHSRRGGCCRASAPGRRRGLRRGRLCPRSRGARNAVEHLRRPADHDRQRSRLGPDRAAADRCVEHVNAHRRRFRGDAGPEWASSSTSRSRPCQAGAPASRPSSASTAASTAADARERRDRNRRLRHRLGRGRGGLTPSAATRAGIEVACDELSRPAATSLPADWQSHRPRRRRARCVLLFRSWR